MSRFSSSAVLVLGLVAQAWCTAPSGPGVASAAPGTGAGTTQPTAGSSPSLSDHDKALQYTRCMSANGVPTPDPDPNGMINGATDNSADNTPQAQAAIAACRHLYDDPANNG